ncbi:MAG: methyltransferase domain-containing protein [Lactobacillales bacterium]|nr:methyltransferase domain-containing protein [Lactobacillales bacterium]
MKKEIKSEYDHEMFEARRELILAGLYEPLLNELRSHCKDKFVLDVGCGEGTMLSLVGLGVGFDISKDGVMMASDYVSDGLEFVVADLTNLPFRDNSVDVILNIFSPSHYDEFARVLKPGGKLIKVIPNSDYLLELRLALYGEANYSNEDVKIRLAEKVNILEEKAVRYVFDLPVALRAKLVKMTPLEWGADEAAKLKLAGNPLEKITVDVTMFVCEL